jgi:hypothetical protein
VDAAGLCLRDQQLRWFSAVWIDAVSESVPISADQRLTHRFLTGAERFLIASLCLTQ